MKLKNKIAFILFLGYLVVSVFLTSISFFTLQKSQKENINVFKSEFLELGRELFNNNSDLFFNHLNFEKEANRQQSIVSLIKQKDPQGKNTIIIDMVNKSVIRDFNNDHLNNFLNQSLVEKIIQENILNQKSNFDFDNFEDYLQDSTNQLSPIQVHLHSYDSEKIIIGYGKVFTTTKIRIQHIQNQNGSLLNSYMLIVFLIFIGTAIVAIIATVILLQNMIKGPLREISPDAKFKAMADDLKESQKNGQR